MNQETLFKLVVEAMTQSHRKYHTMRHLSEMFAFAAICNVQLTSAQRYAILLHDIVYNVPAGETSNEELSAQRAISWLTQLGMDPRRADHVAQIIRDTEKEIPTTEQSALVIDLDLAGLGMNYWENKDLIRQEFYHLSHEEFSEGRLKWLKSMLERDSIFVSGFFPYLEEPARKNIEKEIEILEGKCYR